MTNKIIEAARVAGMTTGDNQKHNGEYWWRSLGRPTNVSTSDLARFYAIARAEALEDAAKAAAIHSQYPIENDFDRGYSKGSRDASERIRALKEQQHG